MNLLVFLVEEPSMREQLEIVLPKCLPKELRFQVVPHEGKSDLEKSIPRKLKGWRDPGVRFIVVRDNDGGNCKALKKRLVDLCAKAGRPDTLVRIVCQELEAWYLGDLEAVGKAYENTSLADLQKQAIYRDPDRHGKPSEKIEQLILLFTKVTGARLIAPHLDLEANVSNSFQAFLSGVRRIVAEP